jgi:tight adherence protein B
MALAFGASIFVSGVLAAAAVARREGERVGRALAPPDEPVSRPDSPGQGWIERRAERRGWPGRPVAYAATLLGASAVAGLAGLRLAGPVGAVAGGFAGPAGVEAWLARRVRARRERADQQLRETVLTLAAGVRAGLSIRRALAEAAREVEDPMRILLDDALRRLDVGEPLPDVLADLAVRLGSSEASLLAALLDVHRRAGGDLPAILDEVAGIVGQRVEDRRTLRTLTAQGRASGAVLAVLPVAFVTLLSWTGGDGLGAFYRTPLGSGLLVAGLVCDVLGFLWIRRIVGTAP